MIDVMDLLEQLEPDVKSETWYVSIYTVQRCYGGAEEGGWWYDALYFEGAKSCQSKEMAHALVKKLDTWAKEENDSRSYERSQNTANMPQGNSPYLDTEGYIPRGWNDGGTYEIYIEDSAGKHDTSNDPRPHYE